MPTPSKRGIDTRFWCWICVALLVVIALAIGIPALVISIINFKDLEDGSHKVHSGMKNLEGLIDKISDGNEQQASELREQVSQALQENQDLEKIIAGLNARLGGLQNQVQVLGKPASLPPFPSNPPFASSQPTTFPSFSAQPTPFPSFSAQPECFGFGNQILLNDLALTELRDQFHIDAMANTLSDLVTYRIANVVSGSVVLPVWSWTGAQAIPEIENLVTEEVNAVSLSDNDFIEHFIAFTGLMLYELEPALRLGMLSNDVDNIDFFQTSRSGYASLIQVYCDALINETEPGGVLQNASLTQILSLRLASGFFQTLANVYSNELYPFLMTANNWYFGLLHKFYNVMFHIVPVAFGMSDISLFSHNFLFTSFAPPSLLNFSPERVRMFPHIFLAEYRIMLKVVEWEKEGRARYYWPKFLADVNNSTLYDLDFDVEGFPRDPQFVKSEFDQPGVAFDLDNLQQWATPLENLTVIAPFGFVVLTYEDRPEFGAFGIKSYVESAVPASEAAIILCECRGIWDTLILPLWEELLANTAERIAESQDDDYPGLWRAKIERVKLVLRDIDEDPISFITPFNATVDITVPFNASLNNASSTAQALLVDPVFAVGKQLVLDFLEDMQARVAEMEDYGNTMLEIHQDIRLGEDYLTLFKINTSKNIANGNPYAAFEDILANFDAETKVVGVNGSLAKLVFESGFGVDELLFDYKEFLADLWVKENPDRFNFSIPANAGLLETNDNGTLITFQIAIDDANVANFGSISDLDVLGRHYGFNADGSVNASETEGSGDVKYEWRQFDYIYRQHFAIDGSALLTPSNNKDPVTNKTNYQFTDIGDEVRRAEFILNFTLLEVTNIGQALAGKNGSYFRWKHDWLLQKLALHIVNTADEKGLLPGEFVAEFFNSTFVDTNDPPLVIPDVSTQFRITGLVGSGSANSGSFIFVSPQKIAVTTINIPMLNPLGDVALQVRLGLFLHEGALGHGFDRVPNSVNRLRGIESDLSWLSTVNLQFGIFGEENLIYLYAVAPPGVATLAEGWATYGELLGLEFEYYVDFNETGHPIPNTLNVLAALTDISFLSRIGARQFVSIGENFPQYAWTLFKSMNLFTNSTNIQLDRAADFHARFVFHPTQQTTYATGLVTNVALVKVIENELDLIGKCLDFGRWVQFRIERTDFILGASLTEAAKANLDFFAKDCP